MGEKHYDQALLGFQQKEIRSALGNCVSAESPCIQLFVSYPLWVEGASGVKKMVNTRLANTMATMLAMGVVEDRAEDPCGNWAQDVVNALRDLHDTGGVSEKWKLELVAEVISQSSSLVSIQLHSNTFTGGAHPNENTNFININQKKGTEITWDDLIIDKAKLLTITEDYFRSNYNLSEDANLQAAGFFRSSPFVLPQEFGFTKAGLLLYYNVYDIADYAAGPTQIHIPYEQLQGAVDTIWWVK